MHTILITGSNGLLGQKLIYALRNKPDVKLIASSKGTNRTSVKEGYTYESLDITDAKAMQLVLEKYNPTSIINTAAMTNVDACETDQENCKRMNIDSVKFMTEQCKKNNIHFIHLSTDFVFDGTAGPYQEDDIPNPLSYYAWSKLESEKITENAGIDYAILRTIIIYGVVDDGQRSNVVLWTKNSLEQKKKINVITDQFRSPTLAEDLADACVNAALKRAQGIYHVSGKEQMSILKAAQTTADFFGLDKSYINPVTTAELQQPALRPLVTGFIIDKAMRELDYRPHTFLEGLAIVKSQLRA